MAYQSVNPYNGKVLKSFKELTNRQLEKAIKTAAACFETWRLMTYAMIGNSVDVVINVEAVRKLAPATP
jgi:acyl-CoA reductase-like NAD-dependent aldehyde dehydrogenase